MKSKIFLKYFISFLFLFLSGLLMAITGYVAIHFPDFSFEQIIYNLFYIQTTGRSIVYIIIFKIILYYLVSMLIAFAVYWIIMRFLKLKYKIQKTFLLETFLPYNIMLFIVLLIFSCSYFGIWSYLKYNYSYSNIFENYYVNPIEVHYTFPENKKNLIIIFTESLEVSLASKDNGGNRNVSVIPNLEKLALDNLNFSNGEKLGGAYQTTATGWTIAGMVAQSGGIPLKVLVEHNSYQGYGHYLEGAYTLGNILSDNGYHNYIMLGSDADFGGRNNYFGEHGNYEILDYYWAIKNNYIDEDYYNWWGFEDSKLFDFAKSELTKISKEDDPFNMVLLTADTHYFDGYIDESCENDLPFNNHYSNSYYCSDKMISSFVEWVKKQPFYDDTVIVIVGDHLGMQTDYYLDEDKNYNRTIYNTIINSQVQPIKDKNRQFTPMDMFPTILASLGIEFDSIRLGLGTNLFTDEKTLVEELGYDLLNTELRKKSNYYNQYILKDDYIDMYKDINKNQFEDVDK